MVSGPIDDNDPNDPRSLAFLNKQISQTAAWVSLGAFAILAPWAILLILGAFGFLWAYLTTGDFFALIMSGVFWGVIYYVYVRMKQEGHL